MAIRDFETPATESQLRFGLAVIDGCIETEWAARELLGTGLISQDIELFYAHQMPIHASSTGLPFSRLELSLNYLEDLLGLDASVSEEFQGYLDAGRHIILAYMSQDLDVASAVAILGKSQSRIGHILTYGHAGDLLSPSP